MLVGLNDSVRLSFLPVGHTKFSPDWCFGLLKQKFRRSDVNCLDDLVAVVESSAASNFAQLVGTQSGEVVVTTYNWSEMFSKKMRKLPNITTYHHFTFMADTPGKVTIQEYCNTTSKVFGITTTNDTWRATDLPTTIPPLGLSYDRQVYLYEKIREYCSPRCKDLVCPKPAPVQSIASYAPTDLEQSDRQQQTGKQRRVCSKCLQPGHNIRSCKS